MRQIARMQRHLAATLVVVSLAFTRLALADELPVPVEPREDAARIEAATPPIDAAEPHAVETTAPERSERSEAPRRANIPRDRRGVPRWAFPAEDGLLPPVGYELDYRPMKGLLYGGIGALAGGYAMGALVSGFDYMGSHREGPWDIALIPLVGPFVAVGMEPDSLANGFYVASGIIQNAGLALTIIGATVELPYFVISDTRAAAALRVGVGPTGLNLSGAL